MSTQRSRAYPGMSLEAAVACLREGLQRLGAAALPRKELVLLMGYESDSGGLAGRKIAALVHYGLLDRKSGKYWLSELGRKIQTLPAEEVAGSRSLREAFRHPVLFREIIDLYEAAGKVPEIEDLARTLEADHGITHKASTDAAEIFWTSGEYADVLEADGSFRFEEPDDAGLDSVGGEVREIQPVADGGREAPVAAGSEPGWISNLVSDQAVLRLTIEYSDLPTLRQVQRAYLDLVDYLEQRYPQALEIGEGARVLKMHRG